MQNLKSFMTTDRLPIMARRFFEGPLYPPIVALTVLVGSVSGTEFIFNIFNIAMMCAALTLVRSSLYMLVPFVTFIYQISVQNTPGHPTFSDYYFTGWRVPVLIILAVFLVLSLGAFLVRMKAWEKLSKNKVPMLIPLAVLSIAFLMNGLLYSGFDAGNFAFALAQVFAYFGLFVIFSVGLSEMDTEESIGRQFAYSTAIITVLILLELVARYIDVRHLFANTHSINDLYINLKISILLGWGVCNPVGVSAAVLIPMNFWGAMKTKHHVIYSISGCLAFLAAVISMSRNAILFGLIAFIACLVIACFFGNKKNFFRISLLVISVIAAVLTIVFFDKISEYLGKAISLGDNGRYGIWAEGWEQFVKSPIFGVGFWSVPSDAYPVTNFMPPFSHQTFVELLAASGIVGLCAYLFYRAKSAIPFVLRPSLLKTMLGISILVLLFESLLDNYIFYIYPMIYYNAALASAFHLDRKTRSSADGFRS